MPPDGSHLPDSPSRRLEALLATYPLPPGWRRPEVLLETIEVVGLRIHLVGLCATAPDGREITGSAADVDAAPVDRAYFELIERVSLAEATAHPRARYAVLDEQGRRVGWSEHADVFPMAGPGDSFRYALSNGVAAGSSFRNASRAALHELVERDRILRSWYGALAPVPVAAPRLGALGALGSTYRLETFAFPAVDSCLEGLHVAAVFGLPRCVEAPLIRGMGAGASSEEAGARAARECLQNLGFLWGESIPEVEPEFSPTPEYHQEYYLWPNSQERLERWFRGEHQRRCSNVSQPGPSSHSRRFADLTPPHLFGRLHIVKGLPRAELSVVFGLGHPDVPDAIVNDLGVHPVS